MSTETAAPAVEVTDKAQKAALKAYTLAIKAAKQAGVTPVKSVIGYMKTDDFMSLRGFGLNRDVEKRMKKEHLNGDLTSNQQLKVAVVITSDKNGNDFFNAELPIMKIDGHSRCAAWAAGQLTKPENLIVEFFFDVSDSEILTEYKVFTESLAQATQAEKNTISNKLAHYTPESEFCKSSWKNAFTLTGNGYDEGLNIYKPVLMLVDKWGVTPEKGKNSTKRHVSGIKAAILITVDDADGEQWETFWRDFFESESQIEQCKVIRDFVFANKETGSTGDNKVKTFAEKQFKQYVKGLK